MGVAVAADGLEVGEVVASRAERAEPVEVVDEGGGSLVAALADGVRSAVGGGGLRPVVAVAAGAGVGLQAAVGGAVRLAVAGVDELGAAGS
jgi:hypothetical protein